MKYYLRLLLVFSLLSFLFSTSCQNKNSSQNVELASIELLRGEITLCGSGEFGEVNFSFYCNYETKETFDLALSLLHSFEYNEAEKAFVQVIDQDPGCPMAYWGVAMSIYHSLWFAPGQNDLIKGSNILKLAESLPQTDREREYLEAIGAYYNDWDKVDHKTRALRYEKMMEQIYIKNKGDTEAAIFYALALKSTADPNDKEYVNQKKAGQILESIFPDQPNHPGIAHYIIHNYDNPVLAHMALPTARRYADIAPSSAHAQHMPSHIFTRLGLWEESINSNIHSASAAQCYAKETELDGHWDEEVHAMDYLVYAYLQLGDNVRANQQYQYLQTIDKLVSLTGPYNFGAIPIRIALENKQWDKAAKLEQHPSNINWADYPWELALTHFARALGASHTGDIEAAEKEVSILRTLNQQLIQEGNTYKANQVLIQIKSSKAWIALAKGKEEEALALMREAAEMEDLTDKHPKTPCEVLPARELLGDMLMAVNKPSEALEVYELDLKDHPNRFNGIYGAAIAADKMGETKKSSFYYTQLLSLVENSGSDRPEVIEAENYLSQNGSQFISMSQ
jgi:tetratricopeptide (TPR) repeat protein